MRNIARKLLLVFGLMVGISTAMRAQIPDAGRYLMSFEWRNNFIDINGGHLSIGIGYTEGSTHFWDSYPEGTFPAPQLAPITFMPWQTVVLSLYRVSGELLYDPSMSPVSEYNIDHSLAYVDEWLTKPFGSGVDNDLRILYRPYELNIWYFDVNNTAVTDSSDKILPDVGAITLKATTDFTPGTYVWQYSTDGYTWKHFPESIAGEYDDRSEISFNGVDLFGTSEEFFKHVNNNIVVRINAVTANSTPNNQVLLKLKQQAPLITALTYEKEKCYNSQDATVTITLNRESYLNESINIESNGQLVEDAAIVRDGNVVTIYNVGTGNYSYKVVSSVKGGTVVKSDAQSLTVTGRVAVQSGIAGSGDVNCLGAADGWISVWATGGTGTFVAELYADGQSSPFMTESMITGNNVVFDGLSGGVYTLKVKDSNNCNSTTVSHTVTIAEPQIAVAVVLDQTSAPLAHNSSDGWAAVRVEGGTKPYSVVFTATGSGQTYTPTSAVADGDAVVYTYNGLGGGQYKASVHDANYASLPPAGQVETCGCAATMFFNLDAPPALAVTVTETHFINWFGGDQGQLTAQAVGGVAFPYGDAYRYAWYKDGVLLPTQTAGAATGLTAGQYCVTVTDANGVSTTSTPYTLTQPQPLVVVLTSTDIKCSGNATGRIAATATGGVAPYNYAWSVAGETGDQISSLAPGTYTLTVTDQRGAQQTTSATITQPEQPVVVSLAQVTPPLAHGSSDGSVTIRVGGGTRNAAGGYTVMLALTSGTAYPLSATVADGDDMLYTYSGLPAGEYRTTVHDDNYPTLTPGEQTDPCGCEATMFFNLESPPPLAVTIEETHFVNWFGGTQGELTAHGTGGVRLSGDRHYDYAWYKDGVLLPTRADSVATGLAAGEYYVRVTDLNGATATSAPHTLTQPAQLEVTLATTDIKCSGNSTGRIAATVTGGVPPYGYSWSAPGLTDAEATALSAGSYTLTVTDQRGAQQTVSATLTQPATPVAISLEQTTRPLSYDSADGMVTVRVGGGTVSAGGYAVVFATTAGQIYTPASSSADGADILYLYTGLSRGEYRVAVHDDNYPTLTPGEQTDPCGCTATMFFNLDAPPPLAVTVEETHFVNWFGGTQGELTAHGTGGVRLSGDRHYDYAWYKDGVLLPTRADSVATGLAAGEYHVRITDANGISAVSARHLLTQPEALAITFRTTAVGCSGENTGTIKAAVTGGVPPYRYEWNVEGAAGAEVAALQAGGYILKVVDSRGGEKMASTEVESASGIVVDARVVQPSCATPTGSITIKLTGGAAPYSVLWADTGSTGLTRTQLAAGVYTVAIGDANGCMSNHSFTLSEPHAFVVALCNDFTMCRGQSRTVEATTDEPDVSYSWYLDGAALSTGAQLTVSKAGTYTVRAVNPDGCSAEATVAVRVSADVLDLDLAVPTRVEVGSEIHAVNLSKMAADRIEWTIPSQATVVSRSDTRAVFTIGERGTYTLSMEGFKGDGASIVTRSIEVVGVGEVELPDGEEPLIRQFLVTPNPSSGYFRVLIELNREEDFTMLLYSPAGVLMDTRSETGVQTKTYEYEVQGTLQGIYTLHLTTRADKSVQQIEIKM